MIPIISNWPFQIITTDILGPLPLTKRGNRLVLVVADHFTKHLDIFALPEQVTKTVAEKLIEFMCRYGVPNSILSDQGRNYQSRLMEELWEMLDVHKMRTSPFHPQCDGLSERFNRTLETMLACFVKENQENWDELLPYLKFAYCTSVHSTTGYTPFELVFGRNPKLPVDLIVKEVRVDLNIDQEAYAQRVRERFLKAYEQIRQDRDLKIELKKFYSERNVRGGEFKVDDRVWVEDLTQKKGLSKKLGKKWRDPYTILKRTSEVNYQVREDGKRKKSIFHVNRLKRCFTEEIKESSSNFPLTQSSLHADESGTVDVLRTPERISQTHCISRSQVNNEPLDMNEEVRVSEEVGELTNPTLEIAGVNETQVKEVADLSFKPNPYQRKKAKEAVEMREERPKRERKKPDRLGY